DSCIDACESKMADASGSNYAFANLPPEGDKLSLHVDYKNKRINLERIKTEPISVTIGRLKRSLAKSFQIDEQNSFCVEFQSALFQQLDDQTTIEEALKLCAFISINDVLLQVYTNVPRLESITASERAIVGYPTFVNIKMDSPNFGSLKDVIVKWIGVNGVVVHEGSVFFPTPNMVGQQIKAQVSNITMKNDILESEWLTVEAAPEFHWQYRRVAKFNDLREESDLRVVSFNLLSPSYIQSLDAVKRFFPYCPMEYLHYNYRSQLALGELAMLNGDVVCLQECSSNVYYKYILPSMESTYHSWLTLKSSAVDEGSATLVRRDKFDIVDTLDKSFKNAVVSPTYTSLLDKFKDTWIGYSDGYFNKFHTIYQFACLRSKGHHGPEYIFIANTHLYFHPNGRHIRLLQAYVLMNEFEIFKSKIAQQHGINLNDACAFICGDFNAFPNEAVYNFVTSGKISLRHPDWSF
ncbi:bifunctional Endonuclease-exonuclease-phosphatase/Endonuclease-exonuclease-phosphatase superfamily, partial [Babesia duncani]